MPLDVERWRDLQLLEAIEERCTVTQRTLAARLGIALGLTNLYVKRLVHKGYIKRVAMPPRRISYTLTRRGAAHKGRLRIDVLKYSLGVYRDARRHLHTSLDGRLECQRVAIYGTGDAAELAFLMLRELGVEPVGVFDVAGRHRFLGLPVQSIADHGNVAYDVLVVALLEDTKAVVANLIAAGIPRRKLLILDEWVAPRSVSVRSGRES